MSDDSRKGRSKPLTPAEIQRLSEKHVTFSQRNSVAKRDHLEAFALAAIEAYKAQAQPVAVMWTRSDGSRLFSDNVHAMTPLDDGPFVAKELLYVAPPAQQQDTAAVVLAEIMAKMREESGDLGDDPMAPFQFDYSWEVLARRADAVLAAPAQADDGAGLLACVTCGAPAQIDPDYGSPLEQLRVAYENGIQDAQPAPQYPPTVDELVKGQAAEIRRLTARLAEAIQTLRDLSNDPEIERTSKWQSIDALLTKEGR